MTDPEELSETLGLAFEHFKALHATLSAVMVDIAALRCCVLKAPKTSRGYCQSLASEVAKSNPFIAIAMRTYEEKLLRIKCDKQSGKTGLYLTKV
jgi:hypothetical protein